MWLVQLSRNKNEFKSAYCFSHYETGELGPRLALKRVNGNFPTHNKIPVVCSLSLFLNNVGLKYEPGEEGVHCTLNDFFFKSSSLY